MKAINFFRCPLFEKCTGQVVNYYDNGKEFYFTGIDCKAPFLTDADGHPVCVLTLEEGKICDYPESFRQIRRAKRDKGTSDGEPETHR